jgi:antirestriction protein
MENSPKIYVTSLSDYNSGSLKGRWFDLSEYTSADDLLADIHSMLKSFGSDREEWFISDFEGFPESLYHEYMGKEELQKIIDLASVSDEINAPIEVFYKWIDEYYDNFSDIKGAVKKFNDSYIGEYNSPKDFAYEIAQESVSVSDVGGGDISEFVGNKVSAFYESMLNYLELTDADARQIAIDMVDSEKIDDDYYYDRVEEIEREIESDPVQYFLDMGYSAKQLVQSAFDGGYPYMFFDSEKYWKDLSLNGYYELYFNGRYYIFYES